LLFAAPAQAATITIGYVDQAIGGPITVLASDQTLATMEARSEKGLVSLSIRPCTN
jgi:hypothetical protein